MNSLAIAVNDTFNFDEIPVERVDSTFIINTKKSGQVLVKLKVRKLRKTKSFDMLVETPEFDKFITLYSWVSL